MLRQARTRWFREYTDWVREVGHANSRGKRFGGALITEFLEPPPRRCFAFRQTYKLKAPPGIGFEAVKKPSGPPLHFHPRQNEWFRCVAGRMAIEIDGKLRILTPEDGEVMGRAGCVHRFVGQAL